jgi:hypothetical protein
MDYAEKEKCADRLIFAIVDRDFYSCVGIGYIHRSKYANELLCKFCELPDAAELFCVTRPSQHVSLFHELSSAGNKSVEFLFRNNDKIVLGGKFPGNGNGSHDCQCITIYGMRRLKSGEQVMGLAMNGGELQKPCEPIVLLVM